MNTVPRLKYRSLWVACGWLLVALVVFLSLTSIPITLPEIEFGDKAGHFFAYFVLMSWFGQLYPGPGHRVFSAIAFIVMGIVLEYLQYKGGVRVASLGDVTSNGLGVVAGWLSMGTPLNTSLAWIDQQLG
jgi:VanZ family protein